MKKSIIAAAIGIVLLAAVLILVPDGSSRHSESAPSQASDSNNSITATLPEAYLSPETEPQQIAEAPAPFLSETHEDVFTNNADALEHAISVPEEAVALYICADGDTEKIQTTLTHIKALSDEICNGIDSDFDKLCAIAQWVSENFYYDYDARDTSVTAETIALENVLETRRTVCMGFSNLYAALCCAQGIDCRVVHGTAVPAGTFDDDIKGEMHEWNVVLTDGRHVWVDALWNTGNAYRNGTYTDGIQHTKYLGISDVDIAKNHRADHIEIRDYYSLLP